MALKDHAERLSTKPVAVRQGVLNALINKAFEDRSAHLLDYNARLFTALRELGSWPPRKR